MNPPSAPRRVRCIAQAGWGAAAGARRACGKLRACAVLRGTALRDAGRKQSSAFALPDKLQRIPVQRKGRVVK